MEFITEGNIYNIQKKNITKDSCLFWDYRVVKDENSNIIEIANYYNSTFSTLMAQKLINKDTGETIKILGDIDKAALFGQHIPFHGKKLVITENEIDAISLSQINNNKYPVVSLKCGNKDAKKYLQKHLEWLETFEEVVFLLHNDSEGIKTAEDCASLLTQGKAKIGKIPLATINEMLKANRNNEVVDAIFRAKTFRQDGIVNSKDTLDLVKAKPAKGFLLDYPKLNQLTYGLRPKELWVACAGSSVGKSTLFREIAYKLHKEGETVGYIALEESVARTAQGFIGIHLNKPIHINRDGVSDEQIEQAWEETLGNGKVFFYDHFGSVEGDNLLNKIRYLAKGCGCKYIFLDHISIAISGLENGDERRIIDNLMTKLRALVEETGIWLGVISHLTRSNKGQSHEEGGQTSLSQLRGSHSIAQLSDMVIGLERDLQSSEGSTLSTIRVLKNRYTGQCGVADTLRFNINTGRLLHHDCAYVDGFKDETEEVKS